VVKTKVCAILLVFIVAVLLILFRWSMGAQVVGQSAN
jgi:hypothetical protein